MKVCRDGDDDVNREDGLTKGGYEVWSRKYGDGEEGVRGRENTGNTVRIEYSPHLKICKKHEN